MFDLHVIVGCEFQGVKQPLKLQQTAIPRSPGKACGKLGSSLRISIFFLPCPLFSPQQPASSFKPLALGLPSLH